MDKEQNEQQTVVENELSEASLGGVVGGVLDPTFVKNVVKDAYKGARSGGFSMRKALETHLPNSKISSGTQASLSGLYEHGRNLAKTVKGKFGVSKPTAV